MKLIRLTQGQFTKVDDADYEWLNTYKWNAVKGANGLYYARRYNYIDEGRELWAMSRVILNVRDPAVLIDHEDRDTLNNQRYNLRLSNKSLNAINSDRVDRATGIYYDINRRRWKAFKLRPRVYVGTFKTREEAEGALL